MGIGGWWRWVTIEMDNMVVFALSLFFNSQFVRCIDCMFYQYQKQNTPNFIG